MLGTGGMRRHVLLHTCRVAPSVGLRRLYGGCILTGGDNQPACGVRALGLPTHKREDRVSARLVARVRQKDEDRCGAVGAAGGGLPRLVRVRVRV